MNNCIEKNYGLLYIPPLPATSPFLSSTDDSSDSDIPDTPPSPTHGTPFTETTLSTQGSPVASGALRCRVMVLAPGQPIPHDHFSLDDSSRDSSSSSSSESSSDSFADALSDSASSRSSSDHSLPTPSSGMRPNHQLCSLVLSIHRSSAAIFDRPSHNSSSASPSHKRSRSPATPIPLSLPTLGVLSCTRADLLPSPKRIRSPETATDLEGCSKDSFEPYVPREIGLGVDFVDESSDPSRFRGTDLEMDVDVVRSDEIDIDHEIQAKIDECIAYADALRDKRIDARVVVEAIDREEIKTGVIESIQRDQGHRIIAIGQQSADMLERIRELTMPNTRSGASRTREGIAGTLGSHTTARNLEPLVRDGGGQEEVNGNVRNGNGGNGNRGNRNGGNGNGGNRNGGNGNRGNGNGNGNGGRNGYNFGGFVPARECTYLDFLKCHPLSFNGTEGVVGLTRWFEKMEMMFHISNCPEKYQVKYASCTLLNSALTWWNSHKRTIGIEAGLWNLAVKGNDLIAYTIRF
ncbi:hypothetical protein Tco_0650744 [Tanacetum coccineum]